MNNTDLKQQIQIFLKIDGTDKFKSIEKVNKSNDLKKITSRFYKNIFDEYGLKISGKKNEMIFRFIKLIYRNCDESCFKYGLTSSRYFEYCLKYDHFQKNKLKKKEIYDCCICMDDIKNDNFKTECDHVFHKECLDEWLKNSSTCPICRSQVGSIVVQQRIPYYYTDGWYGVERDINLAEQSNVNGFEEALIQEQIRNNLNFNQQWFNTFQFLIQNAIESGVIINNSHISHFANAAYIFTRGNI